MQKVDGFGGFFFRAKDPAGLAAWYQTHLGVDPVPTDETGAPWMPSGGPLVFAPFEEGTTYFGNPDKVFMLNFRVSDLEAMIAQLESAGIEVRRDPNGAQPYGTFAWITDPEGTPIELWEPKTS